MILILVLLQRHLISLAGNVFYKHSEAIRPKITAITITLLLHHICYLNCTKTTPVLISTSKCSLTDNTWTFVRKMKPPAITKNSTKDSTTLLCPLPYKNNQIKMIKDYCFSLLPSSLKKGKEETMATSSKKQSNNLNLNRSIKWPIMITSTKCNNKPKNL